MYRNQELPAVLLGLNKGEIAAGRDADLVTLTPELNLTHTIVKGMVLHPNQNI